VASGTLLGEATSGWHLARELGSLSADFPEARAYLYQSLRDRPTSRGFELLARAVEESPDTDGLLLLVDSEIKQKRSLTSWRTVEHAVTEHVPAENWEGAYNIVPVPVIELRKTLLTMTTDGGSNDAAARCLTAIDQVRDMYGAPEAEPRHPDLASGRRWPILTVAPDKGGA
jgi:hypothetical protein